MNRIDVQEEQLNKIKRYEMDALVEVDRLCKKYGIVYSLRCGSLLGAIRHKGFIPWDDDIDICMYRDDYIKFREICKTELNDRFFYQSHETDKEYFHLFDKIRVNGTVFKETYLGKWNIHHGVYIDVFPIDNWLNTPKGEWQYKKFKICRTILYSKYLDTKARSGDKKWQAWLIKFFTFFLSKEYLYRKAEKYAQENNDKDTGYAITFGSGYGKRCAFPTEYYTNVCEADFEDKSFCIPIKYDEVLKQIYGDYMKLPPIEKRFTQHDLLELKL